MTQVHLGRLLGRLRVEGVLALTRGMVEILRPDSLRRLSCLRELPPDEGPRPFL